MTQRDQRMPKQETQTAQDQRIFPETQADIREWLRREVGHQSRPRLGGVGGQAAPPASNAAMTLTAGSASPKREHGEQRAAQRANQRVQGIVGGIDPRDLIRKKLQEIEHP